MMSKFICVVLISMVLFGAAVADAADDALSVVARKNSTSLFLTGESEQKIAQAKARKNHEKLEGVMVPGDKNLPINLPTDLPITTLDEVQVFGTTEPGLQEKSPIQKLRDVLDKGAAERKDHVTETPANDGARYAQVNVGGKIYCIEERRGLIDIAGHVDLSGLVPRPPLTSPMGKRCRTGQY